MSQWGAVIPPFPRSYLLSSSLGCTPNLHTNMIPTKIARYGKQTDATKKHTGPISLLTLSLLKLLDSNFSGISPMDVRIPTLRMKIMLESNPLKSIMLVWRLAVTHMCLFNGLACLCFCPGGTTCLTLLV